MGEDITKDLRDIIERLVRIETQLNGFSEQQPDIQSRLLALEKESERSKDSLKQAHKRIDDVNSRYYWLIGIWVTILIGFSWVYRG